MIRRMEYVNKKVHYNRYSVLPKGNVIMTYE